jgi:hypothetical protein
MHAPKRLVTALAAAAALVAVVPSAASAATLPAPFAPNSKVCLSGIIDPGPLGPMGPYGPLGPWGKDGPMNGQPNPLGDVATCGGALTYILRGGTLPGFVQANVQAMGPGH